MRKDYGEPSRLWSAIWTGDRRLALGSRTYAGPGRIASAAARCATNAARTSTKPFSRRLRPHHLALPKEGVLKTHSKQGGSGRSGCLVGDTYRGPAASGDGILRVARYTTKGSEADSRGGIPPTFLRV
jgi:hypothetical protein